MLPIRVLLAVAHGPRLAFDAHRPPLGGGLGHFDGVPASFGRVPGVEFVLLEGLFDGVGGLAFAFEVVGEILLVSVCVSIALGKTCKGRELGWGRYHARPSLVSSASGGVFDHHVCAFVVVVHVAVSVLRSRWYHGDAVQWTVFLDAVFDHFSGCCPQSFLVRGADGFDGAVCGGRVSSQECGFVRSLVVEVAEGVHAVNGVRPNYMLLPKMRVAVCRFRLLLDHVEGTVTLIAWVALVEGAAAAAMTVGGDG